MDGFLHGLADILLQRGLDGLCLFVLGYVVRTLFYRLEALQEKRVVNAELTIPALDRNATAFQRLADLIEKKF